MFEKIFQRPDEQGVKSPITAVEELIQPDNISMKTRLIDPNSATALELLGFDMAADVPSPKALALVEELRHEGWTEEKAKAWRTEFIDKASDVGGAAIQARHLKSLYDFLKLKSDHLNDSYQVTPSDYMFFWVNIKKINNVSWNGKGRLEFLQGLIGSMYLQNQNTQAALDKITNG